MLIKPNKESKTWAHIKYINVYINQIQILYNININLNLGDNVLILGPNGSGKSTFLKLLNRSIYPVISKTSSFKLFDKEDINIWELRNKVGFLFKEMEERVKNDVTAYDLISSGFSGTFDSRYSKLLSDDNIKNIENLIIELDLKNTANKNFNSLSDGEKRRILLARALVYKPIILVLDEPFCNLDLKSNYILNRTLSKLLAQSVNIIYVTHSLESILPRTNRVILMKEGKIINNGLPEKIINSEILSNLYDIPIRVIRQNNYWRAVQETK